MAEIVEKKAAKGSAPALILWALVLGITGFVAGFFGPITFNPDANQGPMLGIFITGPGAFLFGLALGLVLRLIRLAAWLQWRMLYGCAAALAIGTLYFCMPEPAVRGYAIEGRVVGCKPAAQAIEAAIADWDKRIAHVTWAAPRAGWAEEARQMPQRDVGVVLEIEITRRNAVLEHRKPWDKGQLSASGWHAVAETKSYFARDAGGMCSFYPRDKSTVYFPQGDGTREWPPRDLPNFLGLQVLEPVPAKYAGLIGR